jgi:hypothetical protein
MNEIDLLTRPWNDIPDDLRPNAIAIARDRAGRLALTWTGHPDETTYVERGLTGASGSDLARWRDKPPAVLRADLRVCHFVDACIRAQTGFHRRKTLPKSARKIVAWVKQTRANRAACRDILLDIHCGTPPLGRAGTVEREALRGMMEVVRRENELAEMLLIAMAFYPAEGLKTRQLPRHLEGLELLPLPEECLVG